MIDENDGGESSRVRLLMCWGYHRSGWVRPFEELDDRFECHYLFHVYPAEEEEVAVDGPRHYWSHFRSGQEVLERIAPDRIVFMSLGGAWAMALNHAARETGIPTFVMQHGMLNSLELELAEERRTSRPALKASSIAASWFLVRTMGIVRPHRWWPPIKMMARSRVSGIGQAMRVDRFRARVPDYYITFTPLDAESYIEADNAPHDRIASIGLPEYDSIFRRLRERGVPEDGPVLLIDSPNAENRWDLTTTTVEEKAAFLRALAQAGKGLGKQVLVKLHPESYKSTWLPEATGLDYIRDGSLEDLIAQAGVCVGFDSTLLIPAVWARPSVLFEMRPGRLLAEARRTGAAVVLDSMTGLSADALRLAVTRFEEGQPLREAFARRLAWRTDGHAAERLARALDQPHEFFKRHNLALSRSGLSHFSGDDGGQAAAVDTAIGELG